MLATLARLVRHRRTGRFSRHSSPNRWPKSARFGHLLLVLAVVPACDPQPLAPVPGLPEFQELATLAVAPGLRVNLAGRNLLLERRDLSIDTRLGTWILGGVYNSADRRWRWSFELHWADAVFVDARGTRFETAGLDPGDAIPGSAWVVSAPRRLRTKGGLVHVFAPDGPLEAIHWVGGEFPRLVFRREGVAGTLRVTRIEQCTDAATCSVVFDLERDAAGRLVSVVDRAGRVAEFAWDGEGRLVAARDGLDTARGWPGFHYDYEGDRLVGQTSSEGDTVALAESGREIRVQPGGSGHPAHVFAFSPESGGVYAVEHVDPLGHRSRYELDAGRRLQAREQLDLGERTEFAWEGVRPVERIEPDGTRTRWSWANDHLATRTEPWGNVTRFTWAVAAENRRAPLRPAIRRLEDDLGLREEREYDGRGRLVALRNGAGETTSFVWDGAGNLSRLRDPAGREARFEAWGEHGHPGRVVVGDRVHERRYDGVGNLVRRGVDEPDVGGVVERVYDEDRNLETRVLSALRHGVQQPAESLVTEHRSDGRPLRIHRPHGGGIELLYDALGRLVERRERVDGAWQSTRFAYDAAGRIVSRERPNGMRETWAFDPAGRITHRAWGRAGAPAPEGEASLVWDAGRLVEVEDSAWGGSERYAYDASGRVSDVTYPGGETLGVEWDSRSRLVGLQLFDADTGFARVLGFGWDGADREVRIRDGGSDLVTREWRDGRLARVWTANGLTREMAYPPVGIAAVAYETTGPGGTQVELGVALLDDENCPGSPTCFLVNHKTYVPEYRLTHEAHGLGPERRHDGAARDAARRIAEWEGASLGLTLEQRFDFDALSNVERVERDGTVRSLTYNAERNRLRAVDEDGAPLHAYVWDEAGFAVERDGVPLAWDGAGRIAAVGAQVFSWDALGRPVASSGALGLQRWRFGGLVQGDAEGRPVVLEVGPVRIDLGTGARLFRHADLRGNTAFVTNDAGAVVAQYGHGPYGREIHHGGSADEVGFARGRHKADLILLGARLYDPEAYRFLAPDPIPQPVNDFSYTLGNPVEYWDPSGFEGTLHGMEAKQYAAGLAFAAAVVGAAGQGTLALYLGIAATAFANIDAAGGFPWEGDKTLGEAAEWLLERVRGAVAPEGPTGSGDVDLGVGALYLDVGAFGDAAPLGGPDSGLPDVRVFDGIDFQCAPLSPTPARVTLQQAGLLMTFNLGLGLIVFGAARRRSRRERDRREGRRGRR